MDTTRVINIILSDLSLENLKLQETLERSINSNEKIEKKLLDVKSTLEALALNELMIAKFQTLVSGPTNNQTENEKLQESMIRESQKQKEN